MTPKSADQARAERAENEFNAVLQRYRDEVAAPPVAGRRMWLVAPALVRNILCRELCRQMSLPYEFISKLTHLVYFQDHLSIKLKFEFKS